MYLRRGVAGRGVRAWGGVGTRGGAFWACCAPFGLVVPRRCGSVLEHELLEFLARDGRRRVCRVEQARPLVLGGCCSWRPLLAPARLFGACVLGEGRDCGDEPVPLIQVVVIVFVRVVDVTVFIIVLGEPEILLDFVVAQLLGLCGLAEDVFEHLGAFAVDQAPCRAAPPRFVGRGASLRVFLFQPLGVDCGFDAVSVGADGVEHLRIDAYGAAVHVEGLSDVARELGGGGFAVDVRVQRLFELCDAFLRGLDAGLELGVLLRERLVAAGGAFWGQ